ncbi:MAG: Asp-tRNA(Asn)/Glu-tRNA(Gln) amidotransferase subunit GatB [Planctomycetes bacterium]|nr:Asp-tRNA(Asn)/Glu-tRNA(Gln) amidotransferase subunit GatB [Planctomycetota bacterium]
MSARPPRLVVGVEVHVQLATRTKAFCACPVEFGAEPNALCCPVCLGHPGALPTLNRGALAAAVRAGLALGCAVAPRGAVRWDRKNYFYPDLPKGYQITQYDHPLCENGALALSDGTRVRIRRAHLEEDTGKSSHAGDGETLVDFNRCGVPLLEIVTEPDLGSAAAVEEYLRLLRDRMILAGASSCSMEKGEMRCEPNVSLVRGDGSSTGISELKNLNSFAAVRAAVAFEAKRLEEGPWHPAGAAPPRTTYGWDDAGGRTILQRTKETAADYRYFPEPDLPDLPAEALAGFVAEGRAALAAADADRSAAAGRARAEAVRLGLAADQADLLLVRDLTGGRFAAALAAAEGAGAPAAEAGPALAGWFLGPLAGWVNGRGGDWAALRASAGDLAAALGLQRTGKATAQVVKEHLLAGEWPGTGGDPAAFLAGRGLLGGAGEEAVRAACAEVVAANPDVVAKIRAGKTAARGALVGQVMKRMRGTADPGAVNRILDGLL